MNEVQRSDVSVIIPTYNRPSQIKNAIRSVHEQTKPPKEVVVIDDGSEESYSETIREIKAKIDCDLVYEKTSKSNGAAQARNTGVKRSSGSIVMFLDDDDRWLPNKIENQIEVFSDNPDAGLVYSGRTVVNDTGDVLYHVYPQHKGEIYKTLLQDNVIGITSSVAMRKEVFEEAGGFDPKMPARQDYDLWIRAARMTSVDYDNEPTVFWKVHSKGEQMSSNPELYMDAHRRLLKKYSKEIEELPFKKKRKAYASKYGTLAEKYGHAGSAKKYRYALRSLLFYPNASAGLKLLPRSFDMKIRNIGRKILR